VSGCRGEPFVFDFGEESGQILASEGPLKRRSSFLIPPLKGQQALFQFAEGTEVIGCEYLPLDNREVNFNLIEPAGMDRGVYEKQVGPLAAQAVDCLLAAMGGTIVHDPEDATS
jgi:hypothetical protein